jgi:hypothetical protein
MFGEPVGLEVSQDYVKDIVQSHSLELPIEELQELESSLNKLVGRRNKIDMTPFTILRSKKYDTAWETLKGLICRHILVTIGKTDLLPYSSQDKWIS